MNWTLRFLLSWEFCERLDGLVAREGRRGREFWISMEFSRDERESGSGKRAKLIVFLP